MITVENNRLIQKPIPESKNSQKESLSFIEVFMNGNVLTGRTFPGSDTVGVDMYSKGDKFYIKSFDLWKMNSIWNKY